MEVKFEGKNSYVGRCWWSRNYLELVWM